MNRVEQRKGRSKTATTWRRWYSTARWQRLRNRTLLQHPLCAFCLRENRTTAATVVDHIIPHRGNQNLFWDDANLQSLCAYHHDNVKRREEMGLIQTLDDEGYPI